ncbi:MAG: porin [Campylobacterota bacterium]
MKNIIKIGVATAIILSGATYASETTDVEALKQEVKELREITETLIDETSDLKTGFNYTTVDTTKSHSGLGSAASKVYYSKSPLSIGGYGKMDYYHKSNEDGSASDNIDVYRFIPYIGYKFTDNIIMNTEIEFEHGGAKEGATGDGYVIIEFMYLDFLFNKNLNLRLGNQLMPMGLINEKHEPTLFTTVQRPNTSKKLIPSTWHENGVMLYGQLAENLSYNLGAFSGLQLGRGATEGNDWLRDSRVGSFRIDNNSERLELAGTLRVDYTGINGLFVGASAYVDSNIVMSDLHFDYTLGAFRTYGVYTQTNRSKTVLNEPEKAKGGFINASYDLLAFTKIQNRMPAFVQYESVSAQDVITGGGSVDSTDTITVGLNYFPHEQVVLKADYAMSKDNSKVSHEDETDIFSLSMGFIF